jgi:hypothetical protein
VGWGGDVFVLILLVIAAFYAAVVMLYNNRSFWFDVEPVVVCDFMCGGEGV